MIHEFFPAADTRQRKTSRGVAMKMKSLFAVLALALMAALPVRAQAPENFGGCDNSPENPTVILAGLAGGAFAINTLRLRIRARRAAKK
jgi:XrtJ-associated TM-motif-TM protein